MIAFHIILIVHLVGLAFGLGGASIIDAILLIAARREKVTHELVEVIHVAAGLIAGAMVLLIISGGGFFLVGDHTSPKFWAKMVIVGVACLNGLAAHRLVFPIIEAASASEDGRLRLRPGPARLAAASGAVSSISWFGALILGAWQGLTLGMTPILIAYAGILGAGAFVSAIFMAPRMFVFAPENRHQGVSLLTRLRWMPGAAAYAVALAVADGALGIATRTGRGRHWQDSDGFAPLTVPAFATEPGWRPADGVGQTPRGERVQAGRLLAPDRAVIDDRRRWSDSSAWPHSEVDHESESRWG